MSNELVGSLSSGSAVVGNVNTAFGKDGKSAYEIAVEYGFKGTEAEWLEYLKAAVELGSLTPDYFDRTYLEWSNRTTINTYADLDDIISSDTNINIAFTVMFTGLSPIKSVVGDGTFFVLKSNTSEALLLINVDNGEMWNYVKGSNEPIKVSSDNTSSESGSYWEYAKSSFVESASGLLNMLTEENKIMRIKALEGYSLYSQLGNHEAVVIKTEDGFLLFDLVTAKKYKFDPEGGALKEVGSTTEGSYLGYKESLEVLGYQGLDYIINYLGDNEIHSFNVDSTGDWLEEHTNHRMIAILADSRTLHMYCLTCGKRYSYTMGSNVLESLDKANSSLPVPEFANDISECTDTSKLYVLPDGFYYAYMKKTVISNAENQFKSEESVLNVVMGSSTTSASNGYVWSDLIPVDLTKASPFIVRVKGTQIATDDSKTQKLWLCDSTGAKLSASILHNFNGAGMVANYTSVEADGTFYADYKSGEKVSDDIISNTKYIRVGFAMNPGNVITVADLADVSITFDVDNVSEEVEGWFSTGLAFNHPADYSEEVANLRKDVDTLTEKVVEMENADSDGDIALNNNTCSIFRKVVCCGDSLTAGYINIGDEVVATNEDYAWPHYMALLTGNEYVNCGDSGADVWSWQTRERGLLKAQESGLTQAYLVGLGVNDASLVALGTIEDIGTENETYYGGMSKLIRELNAISPKAKIFIQTMPSTTESFKPYSQAIRDIVDAYKDSYPVHCLDLAAYLPLYQTDSVVGDSIGGHRTAIGYQQFAENLRVIWSEYINAHISEFQDVYSIPYTSGGIDATLQELETLLASI